MFWFRTDKHTAISVQEKFAQYDHSRLQWASTALAINVNEFNHSENATLSATSIEQHEKANKPRRQAQDILKPVLNKTSENCIHLFHAKTTGKKNVFFTSCWLPPYWIDAFGLHGKKQNLSAAGKTSCMGL